MKVIISGLILVTGLQAFAGRTLVELGHLAKEKTEQIQELQIRRNNSIMSVSPGANTYMPWIYMQEARRNSFMGAMGLSSPSRQEQELRANVHSSGGPREDLDKLSREINGLIEDRAQIFADALNEFPEHKLDILESIRTVLVAEKQMFMQEKGLIAQSYRSPYPGARANWNSERDKIWKSYTQIALYEGQMRDNDSTSYARYKLEKQTQERIDSLEAGIAKMNVKIAEAHGGGNSCGVQLGSK